MRKSNLQATFAITQLNTRPQALFDCLACNSAPIPSLVSESF